MDLIRSGVDEEKAAQAAIVVAKMELEKQTKLKSWDRTVTEDGKLLILKLLDRIDADLDDPEKNINISALSKMMQDIFQMTQTVAGKPGSYSGKSEAEKKLTREDIIRLLETERTKQVEKINEKIVAEIEPSFDTE